ncbi:interleukin-7 receptor subunit alpha [Xenentodon cancila]
MPFGWRMAVKLLLVLLLVVGCGAQSGDLDSGVIESCHGVTSAGSIESCHRVTSAGGIESHLQVASSHAIESRLQVASNHALESRLQVSSSHAMESRLQVSSSHAMESRLQVASSHAIESRLQVASSHAIESRLQVASSHVINNKKTEPRILCSSHISMKESSLTCQLMGDSDDEDDEDGGGDSIEKMTLCSSEWVKNTQKTKCLEASGDTVTSPDLSPLVELNVTVHLKAGSRVFMKVDLKKIVKPRRPEVWNVTFDHESKQAVIHVRTPYDKDYLKVDNQMFQLHIHTTGVNMIQNISSKDYLQISMTHLRKDCKYGVRVRAIPQQFFQGTWSDWSETFSFVTPGAEGNLDERQVTAFILVMCLVSVVVVSSIFVFWKNKIVTYMWPSIPHPKQTLVQICKPNKGLLLNLSPEVFSFLNVFPLEEKDELPVDDADSSESSSAQSSDCRSAASASTEELELSALLSRSSSDSDTSLPSTNPSPVNVLESRPQPELGSATDRAEGGGHQQEEAYVTMSSFYQLQ